MTEARYAWPDGKRAAFLFSIDVDVESPLSWRLGGQAAPALGELEQRRFGVRQGLPRLLGLLREHGVRASCFVPTADAERHPDVLPALVDAGHEVGLHGHHHERVDALDAATNAAILDRSLAVFEAQAGVTPRGYRSPAWELTPELHALLRERSLAYDSSLMGYDHPYTLGGLTEIPVEWLTDDAVHFRFRAPSLETWPPSSPSAVLDAWLEEWRGVHEAGGLFTLTVHPWISGRAQRLRLLRRLLEEVQAAGDVWIATAAEMADHHAASANAARFVEPLAPLGAITKVAPPGAAHARSDGEG